MYQQKIDTATAVPFEPMLQFDEADRPADRSANFFAALIVLGLPIILLSLLARFVWKDVKAIGSGIATFYRGAADELSR